MPPPVGRLDVTEADIGPGAPILAIELPANGGALLAEDIRNVAAMALRNDKNVRTGAGGLSGKVDRAGDDAVTGRITITVATTNRSALVATGNGTGYGANATGGATGGGGLFTAGGGNNIGCYGLGRGTEPGVQGLGGATGAGGNFIAGGGNASGLVAAGNGSGSGVSCSGGATGAGLVAANGTPQTNTAPTCAARFAGYIQLIGTDPNPGVDPGANNALHAKSVAKALCVVEVGTGGPYTPTGDSYNIDSVTDVVTGSYNITLKRAMATTAYVAVITCEDVLLDVRVFSKSTLVISVAVINPATRALDGSTVTLNLLVFGKQAT